MTPLLANSLAIAASRSKLTSDLDDQIPNNTNRVLIAIELAKISLRLNRFLSLKGDSIYFQLNIDKIKTKISIAVVWRALNSGKCEDWLVP